ncbi:FmdB family zinc ribbon protein [Methyloversatilis sp.]|jgi:putative FmdB family regulatory protein|uniref:FmdB family zinc ribbon protein n=1 Tax=Methyloversatilis sp. TaxID=2569862 RepID=UPI003D28BFBD
MPIYGYRCSSCGFEKDVMQKISAAPLTDCPSCGASTFTKQLSAAGFQLKGSGWYATDFKGGGSGNSTTTPKADTSASTASSSSGDSAAAPSTPCGGSCACH